MTTWRDSLNQDAPSGRGRLGIREAELGQPPAPPSLRQGQSLTVRAFLGGRNTDLQAVPAHNYPLPFLHF